MIRHLWNNKGIINLNSKINIHKVDIENYQRSLKFFNNSKLKVRDVNKKSQTRRERDKSGGLRREVCASFTIFGRRIVNRRRAQDERWAMKGGGTGAVAKSRGLSVRARIAEKSSEILNAQLPDLFRERCIARRDTRVRDAHTARGTERRRTPTGQRQRKRREDACGDTGCIPSLLSRVSIQRSDKKHAGRRAFEFSSQTCVARKKKATRGAEPYPPSPSRSLSCVESRHCFRFEIHRSPLWIVIKISAIKYIRRYGASLSDDAEFLKITFRPLFGGPGILIVMDHTWSVHMYSILISFRYRSSFASYFRVELFNTSNDRDIIIIKLLLLIIKFKF